MLSLQMATPSLADSAANIPFHFKLNLENFELTVDTTYNFYLYAVRSDRVSRLGSSHPNIPSSASRTDQTSPIVDVIVSVRGVVVIIRGWWHAPTASAPLSKPSLSGGI